MTRFTYSRSIPVLCLGAALLAGLATGCGVELRPRMPTLQARAVIAPASFVAEPAPASGPTQSYVAPAPAPTPVPVGQAMPADVATAGQYQQSGGATRETAEVVAIGSTLIGRVAEGAPRYYVIDLQAGDALNLKAYVRLIEDRSCNVSVKLVEPDDVVLRHVYATASSSTDWGRDEAQMTAKQSGWHVVRVTAPRTVDFKLLISGDSVAN
ncbi:MAG: hypothetical protein GY811_20115 [Myxococcales bacterium]|nr:hypothetical protein [Myxococcales bacterium]